MRDLTDNARMGKAPLRNHTHTYTHISKCYYIGTMKTIMHKKRILKQNWKRKSKHKTGKNAATCITYEALSSIIYFFIPQSFLHTLKAPTSKYEMDIW